MKIKDPHIFKRYDIRGIAGDTIDEEMARAIGRATATYLKRKRKKNMIVGRDGRISSPLLSEAFIEGVLSTGVDVIDIGLCPTPVVYFAIHSEQAGGGTAVTASHNPPEYNGFKICCGSDSLFEEEIQQLRKLIESEDFETGKGVRTRKDVLSTYISYLKKHFGRFSSKIKVAIDCGNGTAGLTAPEVLRGIGCRVVELYCNVDGKFPNHEADPTVEENLQDLREIMQKQKASIGIAFDGDADRIGVLDEEGSVVRGDQLLLIYARSVLKRHPGAVIISEVKSSQVLYDEIQRMGGKAVMWKTGHSLIKARMKKIGAVLAGEMSGHMFFADRYFGFDDALYAACRLLDIMNEERKTIKELLSDIPKTYNTPELRVPCPEDAKTVIVESIKKHYSKNYKVIDIDGARIIFENGWGLVRPSNTQPILVLRFEADSEEQLEEIKSRVYNTLDKLKRELDIK